MLVGRSGLSPTMVGRSSHLDRLLGLLDGLSRPTAVVVSGEAGVGKTRLMRELVERAPAGTVVLAGQADQGSLGRPMEVLIDALEDHEGLDADLLATVTDVAGRSDERVYAGLELVHRLIGDRLGLVVFEDLHWADSESVALFERLADPIGAPLLLIGTFRPDAISRRHPAGEMLPRLDRRQGLVHVRIDRLTVDDIADFVEAVYGQRPNERVAERLHLRSGGNAFFLEELIGAAGEGGLAHLADQPLPWSIAEVLAGQLDGLGSVERRVVEAAAVLGLRVSFDVLAAVSGVDEDELIAALRTLVDERIMVEDEPDVFSFSHALAQEAIEGGLLGRERRRIHERAVDALRDAGSDDLAAIAWHLRGAGRFDELIDVVRKGSRRYLELGSPYTALRLAELGLSEEADDLELSAVAAEAAWMSDQIADGIEHADRWLRLARAADDLGQQSGALRLRGRLAWEIRDVDGAVAAANQLGELLDRLPSDEQRARSMAAIAQSRMLRDDLEGTIEWADRAIDLADRLGLDDVRIAAQIEKGSIMVLNPSMAQEGVEIMLDAIEGAERLGEHVLAARALNNLLWEVSFAVDLTGVRSWIEQMRDHAQRAGYDALSQAGYGQLVAAYAASQGDLSGAIKALAAGRTDEGRPDSRGLWYAVAQAGYALEAGDLDAAARFTADAKPPAPQHRLSVLGLDVHLAARRGDAEAARRLLPDLLYAFEESEDLDIVEVFACLLHDVVSAALPDVLTAADLIGVVETLERRARAQEADRGYGPWVVLVRAQLDEALGAHDAALVGYREASLSLPRTFGTWPAARATAMVGAARCLIALDRTDEAVLQARQAAPLLEGWGGWRVDQLRAVERRLGLRAAEVAAADLTPREAEVAALVAEGLSNAAIGRKLYISPKTVSVHVSNILSKLTMSGRAEIAAWAVREGLSPGGS